VTPEVKNAVMEAETAIAQTLKEVEKTTGQRILGVRIVRYKGGPDYKVEVILAENSKSEQKDFAQLGHRECWCRQHQEDEHPLYLRRGVCLV